MIVVPVKEGENIERAIKKFKRKFDKTGVIKELRRRQQFDKPSEIKRAKMQHAIYVQQMHAHDDMLSFSQSVRLRREKSVLLCAFFARYSGGDLVWGSR